MLSFLAPYLKDTLRGVVVSLLVTGVLALGALIPATRPYFLSIFDYALVRWVEIVALAALFLTTFLWIKIRAISKAFPDLGTRLSNQHSSTSKELEKKIDTAIAEIGSKLSKLSASLGVLETKLSKMEKNISNVDEDIYELKRDRLYGKAREWQEKGTRGALLCRLEVIELDIAKGWEWKLTESLEELYSYVKSKKAFSTEDLSDVKNILVKVKDDGSKEVAEQVIAYIKARL